MGGYKFSRRIGRGGMAEVFLAMREGLAGFEKLVVVKRIFPHFCEDERFVKMFLDEARLAASIRHPNVVEILDITRDEEGYMMVMEYLSGETLALVFETMRSQQVTMPAPIVARIGADIAAGLHYAHTATDGSGAVLDIVHRDVTPSNLIVCFNGTTKIVDFGIAKAQVRDAQTRSGALKGKMAYLSPEQVEDTTVDGRTDVFQLGICLHEMFTGQRLFDAEGDHQKMMAVLERPIRRPSEVNPYVPRAFDDVVLRALHRDVSKRTQSADQLRRELEYALKQVGTTVSDHDVADWMQTTFRERYGERIAMERQCVSQMRAGIPSSDALPVHASNGGKTPTLATVVGHKSTVSDAPPNKRKVAAALIGAGAIVGAALGVFLFLKSGSSDSEPRSGAGTAGELEGASVDVASVTVTGADTPDAAAPVVQLKAEEKLSISMKAEPPTARFILDGKEVAVGKYKAELPISTRRRRLVIEADCYQTRIFEISNMAPMSEVILERSAESRCAKSAQRDVDAKAKPNTGKRPKNGGGKGTKRDPRVTKGDPKVPVGKPTGEGSDPATSPTGDPDVKSGGGKEKPGGDTRTGSDNINPWGKKD